MMNNIKFFFFLILSLFLTSKTYATWSIIAVDRITGEIGIVGASCTFDVQGIASIIPRKGAIVVQAASNYYARMKGVDLTENGATQSEILKAMMDDEFQPEKQQYGLVLLNSGNKPLVYSGSEIKNWNGEKIGNDFAVLGNILTGESVILKAYEAFDKNRDKPLAERLMMALKAGEEAGGDKRCGAQHARSAFISVYNPVEDAIFKISIHGIEEGGQPAVTLLEKKFKLCREESH